MREELRWVAIGRLPMAHVASMDAAARRRSLMSAGSLAAIVVLNGTLPSCRSVSTSAEAEHRSTRAVDAPSSTRAEAGPPPDSTTAPSQATAATTPTVRPVALENAPSGSGSAKEITVAAGEVRIDGKPTPVHTFAIDRTEVTVAAYAQCVAARRCTPPEQDDIASNWPARKAKAEHPINCVTVKQAEKYCAANGQRLPTAAEWMLAAGGAEARPYPWGAAHPSHGGLPDHVPGTDFTPGPARGYLCWVGDETVKGEKCPIETCSVGSYPAGNTPEGIADLAGNVAEWTSTTQKLPHGDVRFVVKGGGYTFDPVGRLEMAVADVTLHDDAHQAPDVGFRCVRATAWSTK